MNCEHTRKFCEKFTDVMDRYQSSYDKFGQEDEDFIQAWKIELVKALSLDFGGELLDQISPAFSLVE